MKIAVFADSHRRTQRMYDILSSESFDTMIHLGDCVEDAEEMSYEYPKLAIIGIAGNNDYYSDLPYSRIVTVGNVKLFLTHGHLYPSHWRLRQISIDAKRAGATLALFGHTHRKADEMIDGIRIVNPGSISLPRDGSASWIRLIIENSKIESLVIIEL